MDNTELKQVAVGVLSTGHWPTHLGLNTDGERIEWLARQLEAVALSREQIEESHEAEIARLEESSVDQANTITRLEDRLDRIARIADEA